MGLANAGPKVSTGDAIGPPNGANVSPPPPLLLFLGRIEGAWDGLREGTRVVGTFVGCTEGTDDGMTTLGGGGGPSVGLANAGPKVSTGEAIGPPNGARVSGCVFGTGVGMGVGMGDGGMVALGVGCTVGDGVGIMVGWGVGGGGGGGPPVVGLANAGPKVSTGEPMGAPKGASVSRGVAMMVGIGVALGVTPPPPPPPPPAGEDRAGSSVSMGDATGSSLGGCTKTGVGVAMLGTMVGTMLGNESTGEDSSKNGGRVSRGDPTGDGAFGANESCAQQSRGKHHTIAKKACCTFRPFISSYKLCICLVHHVHRGIQQKEANNTNPTAKPSLCSSLTLSCLFYLAISLLVVVFVTCARSLPLVYY